MRIACDVTNTSPIRFPREPPLLREAVRHLLNRPRALLAAAGLGAALCVAPAIQAGAATESTFVVLYREGASSSNAASTIASAGGTVVANYSQIGVLVARSSNSG